MNNNNPYQNQQNQMYNRVPHPNQKPPPPGPPQSQPSKINYQNPSKAFYPSPPKKPNLPQKNSSIYLPSKNSILPPMPPLQKNMYPNFNFPPPPNPNLQKEKKEKIYKYGNLPEEEMNKILVFENLEKKITKEDIIQSLRDITKIERIKIIDHSSTNFALIFLKHRDEALRLKNSNKIIKNNLNINIFSHDLVRYLYNSSSSETENLIKKYSDPLSFANLLKNPLMKNEIHKLCSNLPLSFEAHSIRVREIWIGYFPPQYTSDFIVRVLSKYGKVDNINLKKSNQNFAFVRFQTVNDVENCIRNLDGISNDLGVRVKIAYSDFLKRNNIVGDDPYFQKNMQDLSNLVFVCFSLGVPLPSKKKIKKRFSKLGKVINIILLPSANVNEIIKSYFLVEMESLEQAQDVKRYFVFEDKEGKRRAKLGDKKAEVNILLKPNLSGNLFNLITPHLNLQSLIVNQTNRNFSDLINNKNDLNKKKNEIPLSPKKNKININYNFLWTGFITVNKKDQVGVDVFLVKGNHEEDFFDPSIFNLNISHQLDKEEIKHVKPLIIFLLKSSNQTYKQKLQKHMMKLKNEKSVGIINFFGNSLFIVPYDESNEIYGEFEEGDAVGLVFHDDDIKKHLAVSLE